MEIVKAHLEELVKADKKIGAYSDQIQIDPGSLIQMQRTGNFLTDNSIVFL